MKKMLLFLFITLPLFLVAQQGMKFEHGLTWNDIQAKAKAENIFIFMAAFTTWCGPCRYMAATIFPMEKVGKFFNKNFINVKVQLDSTANDNEEVKSLKNGLQAHHKITEMPDGQARPEAAKEIHPDLIITDVMMSIMDGIECRRVGIKPNLTLPK